MLPLFHYVCISIYFLCISRMHFTCFSIFSPYVARRSALPLELGTMFFFCFTKKKRDKDELEFEGPHVYMGCYLLSSF